MMNPRRRLLVAPDPPPEPISASSLLLAEVRTRPAILAPLLQKASLNLLYGPRGLGKTFVAMSIAWAAASGTSFLGWQASRPHRVVYVDGEMPAVEMKQRLAALGPPPDGLQLILSDLSGSRRLPDLAEFAGQWKLFEACAKKWPDVLVIDNLSTLAGFHSNDPDPWMKMQRFFLLLRSCGTAVVIVHHANKQGEQRGTSQKEDVLDLVLALRRPPDYAPSQGARFELHVEKARGIHGSAVDPLEVRLVSRPDGMLEWESGPLEVGDLQRVAGLLREGLNPSQIARELGISRSRAYRLREEAEAQCFSSTPGDGGNA
jgi:KaiC/GvpD/RAD55 family RecA-like ATPase